MKTKSKLKKTSKRKISKKKVSKVSKSKRKIFKASKRLNPKPHKLKKEKILELAEIGKQTVNSEYVIKFLNDVIEDETPSMVAYGEISDAYDNGLLDHRTFVAIRKGLDIYFDRGGGFAKRNPRRNRRN